MRFTYFVLILALISLGFAISPLAIDVLEPAGDIEINQNRIYNVTVNVSCNVGDCGDVNVSLDNFPTSCKAILDLGQSIGDGEYTIYPANHPSGIDVYCDMTTDGGGWTLVFAGMGSTSTYASTWSGWFSEGSTTEITDKSTEGKSPAYDSVTVSTLMLESTYGTDGIIIADLDQTYSSLLDLVGPDPGYNDGSTSWDNGLKGPFTANYPHTGDHFVNDWIRIWVGDGDYDEQDRVVFATQLGEGDWSGHDNPGAIGGEYQTARDGSDWYYVWVREEGTYESYSDVITINNGESEIVIFSVNATVIGNYTYYAYAEEVSNPSVNTTSSTWNVTVYPPIQVIFSSPGKYVSGNDVTVNLTTRYFVEGLDSIWWNNGTANQTYSGETTDYYPDGFYTFTAYANDSAGYLASTILNFNVNICGLELDSDYTLEYDLDCSEYSEAAVIITEENVTLDCDGHSIIGPGYDTGVYSEYDNTIIQNCIISNFNEGIQFYDSSNGFIINNTFDSNYYGLWLGENSDNNIVTYNTFTSNDYGFYLEFADNNQIGHNTVDMSYSNFGDSSCPFVYAWNGEEYDFITDFSSSGRLAASSKGTPRVYYDYVKLSNEQLKPESGFYQIQLTEEYDEISYVDELTLITIDHPSDYDVYTGFTMDDKSDIYTVSKTLLPIESCVDESGQDCTSEVSTKDGIYTEKADGVNKKTFELDLGDLSEDVKLVITYAKALDLDLDDETRSIQIKNSEGVWTDLYTHSELISSPNAPNTYVLDLTGLLVYDNSVKLILPEGLIDYLAVDTSPQQEVVVNAYSPDSANLHYHGYSEDISNDVVDYDYYSLASLRNNEPTGYFTKYGDVNELLTSTDDMYVIMHDGDEISVEFQYNAPEEGMTRDFLVYSWYYYKPAKKFLDDYTVDPLPFVGMSTYPYPEGETYPQDEEHQAYLSEWNTRYYERPMRMGGSLPYSFNNTVFENTIIGSSSGYGLYLYEEDSTLLLNNNISDVEIGIYLEDSSYTLISGNNIFDVETGMYLGDSDYNEIYENEIEAFEGRGINVRYSDYNEIFDNILFVDSTDNCDYGGPGCGGIYVVGCSYVNIITDNDITSLYGHGIAIGGCGEDNDFIGNTLTITNDESNYYAFYAFEGGDGCSYYNTFLHNRIFSDYWIYDDCDGNDYSDDYSGNIYYFADATPSWEVYDDLYDTTDPEDGWADEGDFVPFSYGTLEDEDLWYDYGEDWHPALTDDPSIHSVDVELVSPEDEAQALSPIIFTYIPSVGWEGQTIENCDITVQTVEGGEVTEIDPGEQDGLVALWHFNDDYLDSSGNGHDGTPEGDTYLTPDSRLGDGAVFLDGDLDYVSVPDSGDFDDGPDLTFAAWVHFDGESTNWNRIVSKRLDCCDGEPGWEITLDGGDGTDIYVSDNGWGGFINGQCVDSWTDGNWHHVAVTYDEDTASVYCDGEFKFSGAVNSISPNDQDLLLGKIESEDSTSWVGAMDEVAIWNRALSEDEVEELYTSYTYYTDSSSSIDEGEENTFTMELPDGEYYWSVECTDNLDITGESETWLLTVGEEEPPEEDGNPSPSKPQLSIDLDSSCEDNTITVTSNGDEVAGVSATVLNYDTMTNIASGNTDANGELSFSDCGKTVKVSASKSNYKSATGIYTLDDCCEEEQVGCIDDSDCLSTKECVNGACVAVECECGTVQNHQCVPYDCCLDSDCNEGEVCTEHACVSVPVEPECTSNDDCASGMECSNGICIEVEPPEDLEDLATQTINTAQDAIDTAKSEGKDTSEAEAKLAAAWAAYEAGNFEEAKNLAEEAKQLALNAAAQPANQTGTEIEVTETQQDNNVVFVTVFLLLVLAALCIYWVVSRKPAKKKK